MRPHPVLALTLALAAGLSATPGLAQPRPVRPATRSVAAEDDLLRPYAPRTERTYARPRTPPASPVRLSAAVPSRGVGEYFPGMRPGTSPNRNVIDPRSLCVPGRRALILRGR